MLTPPQSPQPTDWSRWNTVVGQPPQGLHIVIDDQVGEGRGGLRSVAMLADLGLRHFTYLRPDSGENELLSRGHLVQVVTQETEQYSPHGFIADLVLTTLVESPPPFFVLVIDTQDFKLRGTADGKSMIENFGLRQKGVGIHSYSALYHRYRKLAFPDSPLSDGFTMNPWFHSLASELKAAGWRRFGSLTDLFRFTDRDYPLTPSILRLLRYLLDDADRAEELEREGPEYVRRELKPWMEAGEVMAVARAIWWGCNVIDYDLRRLLGRSEPR
jgi:hypothetical protein